MKLITFDAFRTLGVAGVRYIKPERMYDHLEEIRSADWLLFPSYWQINTLLFGLHKQIFPSPATYYLGHNKVEQTRVIRAVFPDAMPPTEIQPATRAGIDVIEQAFDYPLIVKEIRSAQGHGVHLLWNREELERFAEAHETLYVQPRLPIDRDLRIVIVGDEVLTAYWRITPLGGYRANVSQGGDIVFDEIPQAAIDMALDVAKRLDIDHAGFDIAMVEGVPVLLEFNRLFGNQGIANASRELGGAMQRWLERCSRARSPE